VQRYVPSWKAALGVAAALALGCSGATYAASLSSLLRQATVVFPEGLKPAGFHNEVGKPLADALAGSIARSLPAVSASAGVSYSFDPVTGVFVRDTLVNGQVLLERPDPIGKGKWNIALAYDHVEIDTFNGQPLDHLHDSRLLLGASLHIQALNISLASDQLALSATYGITDAADINVTVPLLVTSLSVSTSSTVSIAPLVYHVRFAEDATKVGIGDVLLRGKYQVLTWPLLNAALGLVLRLPSGKQDDFQGTGTVEAAPLVYASTRPFRPQRLVALQPYFNGGVNLNSQSLDDSEGRWGVGLDAGLGARATLGLSVLARYSLNRIAPTGFFGYPTIDQHTGSVSSPPIFGFHGERPVYYDLSVGGRVILWRDTLIAFAHVIVPLNRDGFRSDLIPLAGIEATF
jgi:hypothetical protein